MFSEDVSKEWIPCPEGFLPAAWPKAYGILARKIVGLFPEPADRSDPGEQPGQLFGIGGFEDIIKVEALGIGRYHNTIGALRQLLALLSVSPSMDVEAILKESSLSGAEMIRKMREQKVLAGMRVLDLGAGHGYFAHTAAALGADVVAADIEHMVADESFRRIQVDLADSGVSELISQATGNEFDFVTEWIIAPLPVQSYVQRPSPQQISAIARRSLKCGGYLYSRELEPHTLFKKR